MVEFLNEKEKSTKEHRETITAEFSKLVQIKKDWQTKLDAEQLKSLCCFLLIILFYN